MLKDKIANALQRETYLSGEQIARELNVTRAAVWKAVQSLRGEGYPIEAVPHLGYTLSREVDVLSPTDITDFPVQVEKTVTSTNDLLKGQAVNGAGDRVLLAEEQTQGRGRAGRSFYSPGGTGLYMSVLLHPTLPAQNAVLLTTAAAVAVARAIETVSGEEARIKWVNDVWVRGKKVCGILTEASVSLENGCVDYAVLGIGVNVYPPASGFPPELAPVAGAVFPSSEPRRGLRTRLAGEILRQLAAFCPRLEERRFLEEYRRRLFLLGERVLVNGTRPATALELDDLCHLGVRYDDGTTELLTGGDIRLQGEIA